MKKVKPRINVWILLIILAFLVGISFSTGYQLGTYLGNDLTYILEHQQEEE